MIYQFSTLDDEIFVVNTTTMRWGRASSIMSAPSLTAAEHQLTQYAYLEEGDLIPRGGGAYALDGRTEDTKGPGAGLSVVTLLSIPQDDTLVTVIQANVLLKKESFKMNPIKNFKNLIIQQEPQVAPVPAVAAE